MAAILVNSYRLSRSWDGVVCCDPLDDIEATWFLGILTGFLAVTLWLIYFAFGRTFGEDPAMPQ